jgi:hypothetical protein
LSAVFIRSCAGFTNTAFLQRTRCNNAALPTQSPTAKQKKKGKNPTNNDHDEKNKRKQEKSNTPNDTAAVQVKDTAKVIFAPMLTEKTQSELEVARVYAEANPIAEDKKDDEDCGNGGIAIHGGEIEEKVVLLREL